MQTLNFITINMSGIKTKETSVHRDADGADHDDSSSLPSLDSLEREYSEAESDTNTEKRIDNERNSTRIDTI